MMRVEEMYYIEAEAKAHQNLAEGVEAMVNFVKTYRDPEYISSTRIMGTSQTPPTL